MAYLTVIVPLFRRRVILDKHHLRTDFQLQPFGCGEGVFRECPFNQRLIVGHRLLYACQFPEIITVSQMVMGCQPYKPAIRRRAETGVQTRSQQIIISPAEAVGTHIVKEVEELRMLLTVDLCQLDGHIRNPRQRSAPEKIRGGIVPAQQCFVLRRDNRCELLQITDHQKLNPSERTGITPVFPQCVVDSVQKVGAHH